MALKVSQLSVDLLSGQITISLNGQVSDTGYANINIFAPLPAFRGQGSAELEAAARTEAVKYLEEAVALLKAPVAPSDQ